MSVLLFPWAATGEVPAEPELDLPLIAWDNRLRAGALTASSESDDGAAANALTGTTWDYWVPEALPATLEVELPAAAACDCCAIAAHTCGTSATAVICEYRVGGDWVEAASAIPADDEPLMLVFPEATASRWRIRLEGGVPPAIGVAHVGLALVMERGVVGPYVPTTLAGEVELLANRSLGGQFLGSTILRRGARTEVAFAPLTEAWVREVLEPFRRHFDAGGGFFLAWSPIGRPHDVGWCQRQPGEGTELRPQYREDLTMDVTMRVEAHVAQ